MLRYFATLDRGRIILWCYLAWYVAIVARLFDPSPRLWLPSAGIAVLIGFALNLATRRPGAPVDLWVVFRLYLFPFCVSSYAALIKDRGFILLFPSDLAGLANGLAACIAMLAWCAACRRIIGRAPGSRVDGVATPTAAPRSG